MNGAPSKNTKLGRLVGGAGVAIAAAAYVPSAAAFTPAILLSLFALLLAGLAFAFGSWRLAAMTAYIVLTTLLISPLIFDLPYVDWAMIAFALFGVVVGFILYRGHRNVSFGRVATTKAHRRL